MYTKELDLLQISLTHEYAFCNAVMEITERIADVVTMQKWLLNDGTALTNWKNADLNKNNRLDTFDLVLMKQLLV